MKLLTTLILAASTASSFTAAEENILVTKTITSAANFEQDLADVLPSASVITRWEIEQSPAATIIDLLQSEPGIEIGRNGGPGTVSSIFMRGQASKNVAVFVDGIRMQTDQYGSLKLVDIPTSQIERIEILRGNMSAIYGEAAIGGAINIFTRKGSKKSAPFVSTTIGSRGTSAINLGYSGNSKDLAYNFAVEHFETTNDSSINTTQQPSANPDKDPYDRTSIFASIEKSIDSKSVVGVQTNRIVNSVNFDTDYENSTDLHNSDQTSQDITVYLNTKAIDNVNSKLSVTSSKYEYASFKNSVQSSKNNGDQISINLINTLPLGSDSFSFGATSVQAEYNNGSSKLDRNSMSYFSGYHGLLGKSFDYQVNIRHDEIDSDIGTSNISNKANTWLVGAGYSLTQSSKVTGLYSTSFRAPNTAELSNTVGLKAEEHKGYELGFQKTFDILTARLVKFNTDTNNAISYTGSWSCTSNCYENIEKTKNSGYELELSSFIGETELSFSHVNQDPRNKSDNSRLTRRAQNYSTFTLNSFNWGYDWKAEAVHSSDRSDYDYNTYPSTPKILKPYTVFNLSLSKKISTDWKVALKLENLFDEDYQFAYGYDAVPFGAFLSIQYQPQ